jgi:hypothetical protein
VSLPAPKEQALAIIVRALSPYVGATMAGASVRGICERLGLDATHIHRDHLQRLLDALAPGLDVYVGKERARALVREIWTAMDALEGQK